MEDLSRKLDSYAAEHIQSLPIPISYSTFRQSLGIIAGETEVQARQIRRMKRELSPSKDKTKRSPINEVRALC